MRPICVRYLKTIQNAHTKRAYTNALRKYEESGLSLEEYYGSLSPTNANMLKASMSGFAKWCQDWGYTDPLAGVTLRHKKVKRNSPRPPSPQTVMELLGRIDDRRDLLIVWLLFATGLRIAEAVAIDAGDIVDDTILIRGKGDKQRYAYLPPGLQAALVRYLEGRTEGWLFRGTQGKHLSTRRAQQRLALYGLNPHLLRHAFGTSILEKTGDIDAARRLMGHTSIRTTMLYTEHAYGRLQAVYEQWAKEVGLYQ